jgi:formylmethanofuran dehydrogenase subunit E
MQPDLDRFSQPGPTEKYRIKVVRLDPECEVCGKHVNPLFLREWNDKDVCISCINGLTRDVPEY